MKFSTVEGFVAKRMEMGRAGAATTHGIVSARIARFVATRAGARAPAVLRGAPLDATTSCGAAAMIEIIAIFDR